jgi:hypothetical protein
VAERKGVRDFLVMCDEHEEAIQVALDHPDSQCFTIELHDANRSRANISEGVQKALDRCTLKS